MAIQWIVYYCLSLSLLEIHAWQHILLNAYRNSIRLSVSPSVRLSGEIHFKSGPVPQTRESLGNGQI